MRGPRSLRRGRGDAVLLTVNQVCLLRALRDFARDTAPSHSAWMRACERQLRQVHGDHGTSRSGPSRRLPTCLAERRRHRRLEVRLTDLGRAVLDGTEPMRVVGFGDWRGFDALVEAEAERRRALQLRRSTRQFARGELWGGPLDGKAILAALPPAPELRFDTVRADGTAAVAHYGLWDGLGAPWVTVPGARGEPLDEATRAGVFAQLEGKRGMRYRFVGLD